MKIPIVSGFPTLTRIVVGLLADLGLRRVQHAANSHDALAKLETVAFTVVLADWHLEPDSGLALLQTIRARAMHAQLPFIMMFADEAYDRAERATAAGATACLVKPFDAASLKMTIDRALAVIAS